MSKRGQSTMVDKRQRRPRRSGDQMALLRLAITEIIEPEPPMTVRQVFYQLVGRGLIEKSEEEYHQIVIRLMTEMRLSEELPYNWVVDDTRRAQITETHDGVASAIERTARFYRRSALHELSPDYVEIWCEKEALTGVLWEVTSEYDVPLMPSRGMSSITFLHSSALAISRAADVGKGSFIYQFGDHDPTGVLIPESIERRLAQMCEQLGCPPPQVERIALTEEQIRRHRLPTRPTKREKNQHAKNFAGDSVELDALSPRLLRDMVREVIELHVPAAAVATLRVAEDSERELLRSLRIGDES